MENTKKTEEPTPETAFRLLAIVEGATLSKTKDSELEDYAPVWPDLVYRELLALMFVTILLWIVSLLIDAPLEGLADPHHSPNPAKAPWYFLGLQELLVYFDPWIAGVAIPGLIIVGLMAIPYLDFNRLGTGEYTFHKRKLAVTIFTIGLVLWFVLIFIGIYFRGPSWNWYWIWESWSISKGLVSTTNLPPILGLILLITYFGLGFLIPARRFKEFYNQLGLVRYTIVMVFILLMFGIPGKIFLRLAFNIKYILVTPWFNI